ncbi:MAG: VWA domain-containing protein [Verrucomicrobiota bacterium]
MIHLEWPWMLLGAIPWLLLVWRDHRKPATALDYSSLDLISSSTPSWRIRWAWIPDALRKLSLLLLILALSRPQAETTEITHHHQGIAIELLVDISSSMTTPLYSEKVKLSRIEAVRDALSRFILGDRKQLQGRTNDLIGLISFARYTNTLSPQTLAHDALVDFVKNLKEENRPNEDGTAIGDAVTLAAAYLHKLDGLSVHTNAAAGVKSRVIILLTDGENNCGRHLPLEATALAKEWGIRIYVISISEATPPGLATVSSELPSTSDQILMRMASETGGIYRRVKDLDSLDAVYHQIDSLEKSEIQTQNRTIRQELFPDLLFVALLLLLSEVILDSTLLRRIP